VNKVSSEKIKESQKTEKLEAKLKKSKLKYPYNFNLDS
jgi:hypothetical protein